MYGTGTTAAGGATALAMTGLTTGSTALIAIGLVMAGILLIHLVRRNAKSRP